VPPNVSARRWPTTLWAAYGHVGVGAVGASGAVDDQVARALVAPDDNVEMIEQLARQPRNRDRAVFVGNLDDNVDDTFGPWGCQ
jgi:hypothetical protein